MKRSMRPLPPSKSRPVHWRFIGMKYRALRPCGKVEDQQIVRDTIRNLQREHVPVKKDLRR